MRGDGIVGEWQPIKAAPKDGTSILAFCADNIFIAAWRTWHSDALRGEVTTWWSNGAKNSYQPDQLMLSPTHWMPLPDKPDYVSGDQGNTPHRSSPDRFPTAQGE